MNNKILANIQEEINRYRKINNASMNDSDTQLRCRGFEMALKCIEGVLKDEHRRLEDEERNPKHVYDTVIKRGRYTVYISHKTNYGYWERDGAGMGGLWLTDGLLSDYDGCYQLPKTVLQILVTNFYIPKNEINNY